MKLIVTLLIASIVLSGCLFGVKHSHHMRPSRLGEVAKHTTAIAQRLVDDAWFAGVAVAVIDGDDVAFVNLGSAAHGRAMAADTICEIGSISKVFTATIFGGDGHAR